MVPGPVLAVGIVIGVVILGSLLAAKITGSLGIPQNDGWSYSKTALLLATTGQLHLQGWGQMFLLGQIYTTLPYLFLFGRHESTLQFYGASAALLVLVCTYILARRCTTQWRAVAITGAVSVIPGFFLLTSSYMTDLPATGAALLTMVLGAHAIRRRSMLWLSAALLAGLWAFTIRETLLAALVAVCVSALIAPGLTRTFRVLAVALTGLVLVICAVLEHARHQMPAADVAPWGLSQLHVWLPPWLIPAYLTVGLFVLPLSAWVVLGLRNRDLTQPMRLVGWALGVLLVAYVAYRPADMSWLPAQYSGVRLTVPNYLDPLGAYWVAVPGIPRAIFTPGVWQLIQVLTAAGGVLLTGEVLAAIGRPSQWLERARRFDPALLQIVVFSLLSAAGTAYLSLIGQGQEDRYLIVFAPCIGIALLSRAQPIRGDRRIPAWAFVSVIVLILGFVSSDLTWSTDARDAAVWTAAEKLVAQGINPRQINAGIAWDGTYSAHPAELAQVYPDTNSAYASDCWIVSLSKLDVHVVVAGESSIQPYGMAFGKVPIYILHRPGCGSTHRPSGSASG